MSEFQTGVATLPFQPRMADTDEISGDSGVVALQTGFGPVTPRAVTIMSYHFLPKTIRFWHSNRKEFYLPAAKRDPKSGEWIPGYCTAYDSQQAVPNISADNIGPNAVPVNQTVPMPVSVQSIVHDMISDWGWIGTSQMARHRVGIIPIAGRVGTEEEKKRANKLEEGACRRIVEEADQIAAGAKGVITELHRGALDRLGSEKRTWYKPIEMGRNKKSVATGNIIPMEALVDGAVDLIEFYVRHNLNPKDYGDEYLANKTHLLDAARKRMFPGAQTKQ
jgi:hypothetical protein